MTDGVSDFGSVITFNDGGGADPVGECFVVSYPELTGIEIAYRTHASGAQRKIPSGATATGDVVLNLLVDAATLIAVDAAIAAGTTGEFVITNDVFTMTWDGFYKGRGVESNDSENPNVLKFTATIACDGLPVVAAVSPAGDWWDSAIALSVIPADIALTHPGTQQLVVKAIMPTGAAITVPAADLTFTSSVVGKATVNAAGLVTTVAAGSTTIHVTVTDGGLLDAYAEVVVS
jgi:hypothetical protein